MLDLFTFFPHQNVEKIGFLDPGCVLKPLVAKFRSDLSIRLRDITEKQVPAKLKP